MHRLVVVPLILFAACTDAAPIDDQPDAAPIPNPALDVLVTATCPNQATGSTEDLSPSLRQLLQPTGNTRADFFGSAVATAAGVVVVAAISDDGGAINRPGGSVSIYELDAVSGNFERRVYVPHNGDYGLGRAVATDGDTVVFSASNPAEFSQVYIYERDARGEWQQAAIVRSDHLQRVGFGSALTLDGDRLFVRGPDGIAMFDRDADGDWLETDPLLGTFGALSAHGDTLVATGEFTNADGDSENAVFVYGHRPDGSWTLDATLIDGPDRYSWSFGTGVALHGDTAVIGAKRENRAYIFERNEDGWCRAADFYQDDGLGSHVALQGDTVVIGRSNGAGGAHVYERLPDGAWSQRGVLTQPRSALYPHDTEFASIDGDRIVVGQPSDDTGCSDSCNAGAAYIYDL